MKPAEPFGFIPADTNAIQPGEYACLRFKAMFPAEIGEVAGRDEVAPHEAARRVLYRDRQCAVWCQYHPGVDPAGHLQEIKAEALERDRRRFEQTLADFQARLAGQEGRQNKRLTLAAIGVTLVLGLVQLWAAGMSMVPEAIGIGFGRWVVRVTEAIAHWFQG